MTSFTIGDVLITTQGPEQGDAPMADLTADLTPLTRRAIRQLEAVQRALRVSGYTEEADTLHRVRASVLGHDPIPNRIDR